MRVIQDNQTIEWEANAPFLEKHPEVPVQITSADGLILNDALYPIDISKETPQSRKPQQCICKILQMHRAHYPAVFFYTSFIIGFGLTLFWYFSIPVIRLKSLD